VPAPEALLLVPCVPSEVRLATDSRRWSDALNAWSLRCVQARSGPDEHDTVVVFGKAKAAARSGAALILVDGPDRRGYLRRAGYAARTYVAARAPGGAIVVSLPRQDPPNAHQPGALAGGTLRRSVLEAVRRASGRHYVTVAHRGVLTPFVLTSALGSDAIAASLVTGGGGPRRRSAFLVSDAGDRGSETVVKVGPLAWGPRGAREQEVLRRLHDAGLGSRVPQPLGAGQVGPVSWSVETLAKGRPLADALGRSAARSNKSTTVRCLEDLAKWFADLGAATAAPREWQHGEPALALRGEHRTLAALRSGLPGVPGVLVHGDIASGFNVLVDERSFTVIDWETAADAELPLTDVLPILCNAMAARHGRAGLKEQAEYILRLCAGQQAESSWLLSLIRRYCRQVGVPAGRAGALGALAWGYQASMRLHHEELVVAAGGTAPRWTSAADAVARAWLTRPHLGLEWSALTAGDN
jgi:hypothetical protein